MKPVTTSTGPWAGWILMVLFPACIGIWAGHAGWSSCKAASLDQETRRLAETARHLIASAQPETLALHLAEKGQGKSPLRVDPDSETASAAFLLDLSRVLADRSSPRPEQLASWRRRLGTDFRPEALRQAAGSPFPVRWGRHDAWLVWRPEATPTITLSVPPPLEKRLKKILSAKDPHMHRMGIHLLEGSQRTLYRRGSPPEAAALSPLQRPPTPDRVTHREYLGQGLTLFLEARLPFWVTMPPGVFAAGLFLLLVLGSMLFRRGQSLVPSTPFRFRLVGLFGYMVGMPLAGVGVLWLGVAEDRLTLVRSEEIKAARNLLFSFDDEFRKEQIRTARAFRNLIHHPDLQAGRRDEVTAAVREGFRQNQWDWFEWVRWQPRSVLRLDKTTTDDGFNLLMDMMGDQSWSLHPEFRRLERQAQPNAIQMVLQGSFDSPLLGIRVLLNDPGRLLITRISRFAQFYMWQFWPSVSSPRGGVRVIQSYTQAVSNYLRRETIRNRPYRILVRDPATSGWIGLPRSSPSFQALVAALQRTRTEQIGEIRIGIDSWLAVAIPGKLLEPADLVALIPPWASRAERARLVRMAAAGFALVLAVSLLCAWLLAETLLRPITDLAAGVAALRQREGAYRIPVRRLDELGRTALAFNRMLENVQEIKVAREIQHAFLPTETHAPTGYEMAWQYRVCSSLGGDYLDVIPFADGTFAILLGDVVGHGIGAGLIMAIAKGIVTNHRLSGTAPHLLLQELNEVLFGLGGRGTWMTACLGLLDPSRHRLRVILAGHPYPWLWQAAGGRLVPLGQPSVPLGGWAKPRLAELEVTLEPGDQILFFTDGYMESPNPTGMPFGYERLGQCFADVAGGPAEATVNALTETLQDWCREGMPADDVSYLALRRSPEGWHS